MARLRFPGRPGQRIGKNYVKYIYDDIKIPAETCLPVHNKIEVGLKLFHEIFGYSDEEEEFDGFTSDDIAEAEASLALKLTQKQAVDRYLLSTQDPPSGASDVEKLFPSSDSEASSSSSIRQRRGMRNILRKSYDKMIKEGLCKSSIHNCNLIREKDKPCIKQKYPEKKDILGNEPNNMASEFHFKRTDTINKFDLNIDSKIDNISCTEQVPVKKKSIVNHLLEKVKKRVEKRGRPRKDMRPGVKKKFKKRFSYVKSKKYSDLKKKLLSTSEVLGHKDVMRNQTSNQCKSILPKSNPSCSNSKDSKVQPKLRSQRVLQGYKKFVLPQRSIRSARKIIPRKRYLDESDKTDKKDDDESQCSRSSFSGSSETTSAMDGGSSPEYSQCEDANDLKCHQKKMGLYDRPLVVEGKRPWKPSLKVQMKLSEMNYEHPFALKKSEDGSSGTNTSSGSFKDIIKPDMVSKYAEKMAKKAKERPVKPLESQKHSVKDETEDYDDDSSDVDGEKKPEDKLEKVAAKIEKLLKSQWEGRLKDSSAKSNEKISTNLESAVTQWKNEHQLRTSNQRRTKNIIRKAKLQLKKKNLNLRTRRTVKDPSPVISVGSKKTINTDSTNKVTVKVSPLASSDSVEVPLKNAPNASIACEPSSAVGCTICGFLTLFSHTQKLYDQVACEACNKFFESFAKTPKQYFCMKDGNCSIDSTKETSRKLLNSRCKACWLKVCMEKFTVSAFLRSQLIKYVPRLDSPPHNPLVTDNVVLLQEPITFTDLARFAEENKSEIVKDLLPQKTITQATNVTNLSNTVTFVGQSSCDSVRETRATARRHLPQNALKDSKIVEDSLSANFTDPFIGSTKPFLSGDILDQSKNIINKDEKKKAQSISIKMSNLVESDLTRSSISPVIGSINSHNKDMLINLEGTIDSKDSNARGPRIKHVCRRAAVALGLPRATFPKPTEPKETFNLSALPQEEKQKILETVPLEENKILEPETVVPSVSKLSPTKTKKTQGKRKTHKTLKLKSHTHMDLLKKSSLLIQKEQKRRKLLMKKSMKHLHKHSFKKSLKLGKRNEMKKTLKFSYKSAVKTTSVKSSQRTSTKTLGRTGKLRKVRCKQCEGCLADDCGKCAYCLDKKKFGGPDTIKQACMYRRCLRPVLPASERKGTKQQKSENSSKDKPSGDHSSFGGDGPSGIGLSLTSSSSSPTSPDGSSCGSSCSSSSTSSSSGSSGSSSSSSSSNSSTTTTSNSTSDNINISHSSGGIKAQFVQNTTLESINMEKIDCSDTNVITNSHFQVSFCNEDFDYESDFQDLAHCGIAGSTEKKVINGNIVDKENGDTILYENSSSIIQMKNASYTPSLMYNAALGGDEDVLSYSSNTGGCRNTNSRQNGTNLRQSQFNQDRDQYGSAGSGDQESNGEDDDEEEDHYKKKHYIYADYWEEYDFERISSQGFALISSQHIPLPCVCYLCGSAGEERLIFCVLCCEPYHTFCLPENDIPHEENIENWCCKKCQSCSVCGLKTNLLKCKKCQNTYHSECLTPHYPTKPSRKKRIWMCPKCVKCKSCGTTSPASGGGPLWNFDLLLCQACAKLTDKGNYCPVCQKCYEENDYESEMVQCYECLRWVHATCDNISDEGYEILSCLPETVVYTCVECTVESVPMWRKAIKEHLKQGLKNILHKLMSSRCASHLISNTYQRPCKTPDYMKDNVTEEDSNDSNEVQHVLSKESKLNPLLISEITEGSTDSLDVKTTVSALVSSVNDVSACVKNMLTECEKSGDMNCAKDISSKTSENDCCKSNYVLPLPAAKSHKIGDKNSLDLYTVRTNLEKGKYPNIASFFEDVLSIIEAKNDFGKKHYANEARTILSQQTEKIFPWFKIPVTKVWTQKIDLPEGMLPNAILPPYVDHTYSQYLERVNIFPLLKTKDEIPIPDTRLCVLCGYAGDSKPKKCGRLIYCGQDDWIHVNCAMWSAEVFQQEDGSLRNVYPAVSRGKVMHCEFCNQAGATVGCCVRGCPANYHFYCARKDEAILQEDKKIFCALHKDNVDERVVNDEDFLVKERVFVNQTSITPKWVKKEWENPMDKDSLQISIGSLTVTNLGRLSSLSTGPNILIPVGYECTRLFWSTKNPKIRVKYRCRVIEMKPEKQYPLYVPNTTTIHTVGSSTKNDSDNKKQTDLSLKNCFDESEFCMKERSSLINEFVHFGHETVRNEVKKILNCIIKKVAKRERKIKSSCDLKHFSWKDNISNPFDSIFNNKFANVKVNGLHYKHKINIDEIQKNFVSATDCDLSKEMCSIDSKVKNESFEFNDVSGSDKSNYLDYYASLFKINSKSDILLDEKLDFDSDLLTDLVSKDESKNSKKRRRSSSLDEMFETKVDRDKTLLNDVMHAKEKYERLLHRYKDIDMMPSKKRAFLESVVPSDSIKETVLPVYSIQVKENSGITESSGYSSNDDSHFRQTSQSFFSEDLNVKNACNERPRKPNSMLQRLEECRRAGSAAFKKDGNREIKFNSSKIENQNNKNCETNSSESVVDSKNGHSKSSCLNGVLQAVGPFKCNKCKRLYRTNESFQKHIEACNFVIDSSSGEESDTTSEEESASESYANKQESNCNYKITNPNITKPATSEYSASNNINHNLICDNNQNTLNKTLQSKEYFKSDKNINSYTSVSKNECLTSVNSQVKTSNIEPKNVSQTQKTSNVTSKTSKTNYESRQQSLKSRRPEIQPKPTVSHHSIISAPIQQNLSVPIHLDQNCLNPQGVISNITVNNASLTSDNISNSFNCTYGSTTLCNSPASNVMQLPCNTLIIPPNHNTVSQPGQIFRQISAPPPNNFLPSTFEVTQNSQLSYVGSITITNNETMSLAVNVPDRVVPVYPQQELSFNLIQSPLQLQQTSEIHLSSVNVQQISIQGSYASHPLNQLVFPTQTVNIPQNQVMFVEDPISQQISTSNQTSNYILQVPVEQSQNCSFNAYVPQQEFHPQFLNQASFHLNGETLPSSSVENTLQQPETLPRIELAASPKTIPLNSSINSMDQPFEVTKTPQPPTLQKINITSPMPFISSPSASDFSNRSSPISDRSNSSKSCAPPVLTPNSNIMDILKKAAEQMINISNERSKKKESSTSVTAGNAEQKTTRFAHTRKVAARKAEKLKKKNPVVNGKIPTQNKPKSIQLNIAALKQAFMPFLMAPVAKDEPSPVPLQTEPSKPSTEKPISLPVVEPQLPSSSPPPMKEEDPDVYSYHDESENISPLLRLHLQELEEGRKGQEDPIDKPYLMYEITSEDGLHVKSRSIREAWGKVYEELQDSRIAAHMDHRTVSSEDINGFHMMGLDNQALMYLLEQLPGAEQCPDYEFIFHPPNKELFELPENPTGCARSESFNLRRDYDMFNFLASEHRNRPVFLPPEEEEEGIQKSSRRATSVDVPIAMRFRNLKTVARETVGVYRSSIHGRGLFCKRNIDAGELVIEYAGEVIRSVLTDKRERIYQSKGIGCYMFRIDDDEVVDATMHGNAARFINHSCEPNCFSKVITVDGKKHIVIFALRKIIKGEELTYDYKFPFEEEKIPCHCNSRRCRKYLN